MFPEAVCVVWRRFTYRRSLLYCQAQERVSILSLYAYSMQFSLTNDWFSSRKNQELPQPIIHRDKEDNDEDGGHEEKCPCDDAVHPATRPRYSASERKSPTICTASFAHLARHTSTTCSPGQ